MTTDNTEPERKARWPRRRMIWWHGLLLVPGLAALSLGLGAGALAALADAGIVDPFAGDGSLASASVVGLWICAIFGTCIGIILDRKVSARSKGVRWMQVPVVLFKVLFIVWGIAGGSTFAVSALRHLNDSTVRLAHVIKRFGVTEDMCQALALGMHVDEVKRIMGEPISTGAFLYCPVSNSCRSVDFDSEKRVVKIECWNGATVSKGNDDSLR